MERPRLAVITPGSFPVPSGKSSSVEHTVSEWTARLAAMADCTVFGIRPKGYAKRETIRGVAYARPAASRRRGYLAAVIRLLKKGRYDVIQVENRPRYVRAIRRAFPGVPVWLSLHSLTFLSERRIPPQELAACLSAADRIVVNSEFLKEEVASRVPSVRDRIFVNYLGVNLGQFTSRWTEEGMRKRERMLKKLGLQGRKIVLYVGRLVEMKGVHHLLEAFPAVAARHPDAVLVVVGSAYYGSKRKTAYVRRLHRMGSGMPRHVKFVSYVPHEQIQDWFRLADVVVVPSFNREAFGLVNVEAMATGVPVVATLAGGMKEIVLSGVTGYLVDPALVTEQLARRIGELLSDVRLRQELGEAGLRRVADTFTWEHTALRWLQLFRQTYGRDGEPQLRKIGSGGGPQQFDFSAYK